MTNEPFAVAAGVIEIVAEPDLLESCVEVALIVASPDDGAFAGAVYKPVEETVPESTDHVTAEL